MAIHLWLRRRCIISCLDDTECLTLEQPSPTILAYQLTKNLYFTHHPNGPIRTEPKGIGI